MSKKLLEESIIHWQELAEGTGTSWVGRKDCALCEEYWPRCEKCPVAKAGHPQCKESPYDEVLERIREILRSRREDHNREYDRKPYIANDPIFQKLAAKEVEFLKSLKRFYND